MAFFNSAFAVDIAETELRQVFCDFVFDASDVLLNGQRAKRRAVCLFVGLLASVKQVWSGLDSRRGRKGKNHCVQLLFAIENFTGERA